MREVLIKFVIMCYNVSTFPSHQEDGNDESSEGVNTDKYKKTIMM